MWLSLPKPQAFHLCQVTCETTSDIIKRWNHWTVNVRWGVFSGTPFWPLFVEAHFVCIFPQDVAGLPPSLLHHWRPGWGAPCASFLWMASLSHTRWALLSHITGPSCVFSTVVRLDCSRTSGLIHRAEKAEMWKLLWLFKTAELAASGGPCFRPWTYEPRILWNPILIVITA